MSNRRKDIKMFRVRCGNTVEEFLTLEDARAFAEKASWDQNSVAELTTPRGQTQKIKVGIPA